MNIGLRINRTTGQFMRTGLPGSSGEKRLMGVSSDGKKTAGESSQMPSPSQRMRMAEMNQAQSALPQGKREVVFDPASGTSFDAQRMSRSAAAAQKKMKKLQYNFKLISSQIMRAKTSSSAAKAVSSAKRMVAQLRRKRKSGEYDDEELEAAIMHAQAMERVAKKHVKNLQQEERVERGMKAAEDPLPEEECGAVKDAFEEAVSGSGDDLLQDPAELTGQLSEEMAQIQEELSGSMEDISQELSEEMAQLMQEYEDMMSETMEELGGDLLESLSAADTDMEPEDLKALKQKHRAKELQEIAKADAKYLKAIFQKYAADRQQASGGVNRVMGGAAGASGGVGGMGIAPQAASVSVSASASVAAPAEGGSVDVSV